MEQGGPVIEINTQHRISCRKNGKRITQNVPLSIRHATELSRWSTLIWAIFGPVYGQSRLQYTLFGKSSQAKQHYALPAIITRVTITIDVRDPGHLSKPFNNFAAGEPSNSPWGAFNKTIAHS